MKINKLLVFLEKKDIIVMTFVDRWVILDSFTTFPLLHLNAVKLDGGNT